jgi:hypothetical protein
VGRIGEEVMAVSIGERRLYVLFEVFNLLKMAFYIYISIYVSLN